MRTNLSLFPPITSKKTNDNPCQKKLPLKRPSRSLQTAWHAVCRLHGHRAVCRLHGAVCRLREVSRLHGTSTTCPSSIVYRPPLCRWKGKPGASFWTRCESFGLHVQRTKSRKVEIDSFRYKFHFIEQRLVIIASN